MSISREAILESAKAMTPAERYDLIEDIRQILDDDEFSPEQIAELRKRAEAADRNGEIGHPVEEVIADLRDKLRKRRRRRAS